MGFFIVVVRLFAFLMAYHILSSKCHSGTKKFAVHGEKHNHETKRLFAPVKKKGQGIGGSSGIQRPGLTQWQGNISEHHVLFLELE